MLTTIQMFAVVAGISFIIGIILGWKLTFNARNAKIQEQQYNLNNLKDENKRLKAEIRSYKIKARNEKIGKATEKATDIVGGAVGGIASGMAGVSKRIFRKRKQKEENKQDKELEELKNTINKKEEDK